VESIAQQAVLATGLKGGGGGGKLLASCDLYDKVEIKVERVHAKEVKTHNATMNTTLLVKSEKDFHSVTLIILRKWYQFIIYM
jgi:hypothetical protein